MLLLGSPAASNAGLIEAVNTGGLLVQEGTIDNAGGTILASGTSDNVILQSALISGGTLTANNGGLIEVVYNNTTNQFSGADTLDGSATPLTITSGTTLDILDTGNLNDVPILSLNGTIANSGTILNATAGHDTDIQLIPGATAVLSGGGVVDLARPRRAHCRQRRHSRDARQFR